MRSGSFLRDAMLAKLSVLAVVLVLLTVAAYVMLQFISLD